MPVSVKSVFKLLPKDVQRWLRVNFLYKFISSKQLLVDEMELSRVFDKSLDYLLNVDHEGIGDYLEFGVYNGTSMSIMYRSLMKKANNSAQLFGFDSFEGLPDLEDDDSSMWYKGQFKCDYNTTIKRLKSRGVDLNRIHLIKGFYSDTLNEDLIELYKMNKASIILIDCDMYSSTRDALNFCQSLIKEKAIILFDDWHKQLADKNLGQKKAFDEFIDEYSDLKISLFEEYRYKNKDIGKAFLVQRNSTFA